VSGHLREVSLSVLPQSVEDGNIKESDDSDVSDRPLGRQVQASDSVVAGVASHNPEEDRQTEDVDKATVPASEQGPKTPNVGHEIDLNDIIERLLEVRGLRPGKQVQLPESEIRYLCTKAREIFRSQPMLLELVAPLKV
jgi:hypothetical protein